MTQSTYRHISHPILDYCLTEWVALVPTAVSSSPQQAWFEYHIIASALDAAFSCRMLNLSREKYIV